MTIRVPNAGESYGLGVFVNKTAPENLVLRLYSNNKTPAETDVVGDYTEVVGFGYAAVTLAGASWVIAPGDPASAVYPTQTFTFTGAFGLVYGYYMTLLGTGTLILAERFPLGPYNIQSNGENIVIPPTITLADTLD